MFVFKKLVSQIFFPVPLTLLLLFAGLVLLWRNRRVRLGKLLVSAGTLVLLLSSWPLIGRAVFTRLERDYAPCVTPPDDLDALTHRDVPTYVVALGMGFNPNPEYPFTMQVPPGFLVRVLEAVRIHRALPGSRLILSIPGPAEQDAKTQFLDRVSTFLALDPAAVTMITDARTTREEARFVHALIGNETCCIVTEARHLPRAERVFRDEGIHALPVPCQFSYPENTAPQLSFLDVVPSSDHTADTRHAQYELMGLAWETLARRHGPSLTPAARKPEKPNH